MWSFWTQYDKKERVFIDIVIRTPSILLPTLSDILRHPPHTPGLKNTDVSSFRCLLKLQIYGFKETFLIKGLSERCFFSS